MPDTTDVNDMLEKTAPLFGLRKIVHPDGRFEWGDKSKKTPIGSRESIYPHDAAMIAKTIGVGSIILDLNNIDFELGAMQISDSEKCFWLLDGRKVTISMDRYGIFASVSNIPDENAPKKSFIDRRTSNFTSNRDVFRKCLHPECDVVVDTSKRKSGCCSKAHMSFECIHPSCVERAKKNGWSKATHPFGTKIAKAHWEFRSPLR